MFVLEKGFLTGVHVYSSSDNYVFSETRQMIDIEGAGKYTCSMSKYQWHKAPQIFMSTYI